MDIIQQLEHEQANVQQREKPELHPTASAWEDRDVALQERQKRFVEGEGERRDFRLHALLALQELAIHRLYRAAH